MTRNVVKVLGSISVFALVLASSGGATEATIAPAGGSAAEECIPFEDWERLRWFGLWSEKYHVPSSPHFNPHEYNRWWNPVRIVDAWGTGQEDIMDGRTLAMHEPCQFWQ
ncbi:MAG: hypothetical protein F4059_02835 [Gemmatimonadetes bacterium]|nr:hypothetical protein [Gemmatimonadota bacterium]